MSRIVVVTGGGAGLGRSLARAFAAKGDTVVVLGRTAGKLAEVVGEMGSGAAALGCDVASPDSVRAAFAAIAERFGRIDVLVNNAATYEPFFVADATDEQILAPALTNFVGPILTARAAIPLMAPGAQIVNVSSESVVLDYPMLSLYQGAKAGMERFSESLRKELKGKGIRVTVVRAGAMYDEDSTAPAGWDPEAARTFGALCAANGIDLRGRPGSHFRSVAGVVHALTELPADVAMPLVQLDGFRA